MVIRRGDLSKMPCESCAVQFSVFRRKRACCECERYYCSGCLRRGGGAMCAPCRVLSTRPLSRQTIAHLKVRDLQCFLHRQNVSTRGCVEKEELVSLCVAHVNSAAYRRRGSRSGASPFSSLKGFTNNINVLINNAFDLRTSTPAPPPPSGNCYNSSHSHPPPNNVHSPPPAARERFTTRPGGEADISVPVPPSAPAGDSGRSQLRDTDDCFEVEDLDDAGWEFVTRPADPLPNDSDILIAENDVDITISVSGALGRASPPPASPPPPSAPRTPAAHGTPQRAASELELHRGDAVEDAADTSSLQDEPIMGHSISLPKVITLDSLTSTEQLEQLSVKQLKELLTRNRVEFRGCVERAELLSRARTLYSHHRRYRDDLDSLPLEECCKICMAAPLECVLLECGHMAACTACSKQLAECPICRQYVVRAVRVFRS
ncbi:E3 ubiquitin-protein ligase RNF34 [Plodia interpunctella]|uniref:E3 ubiquitin-protein ligase RNF34 n=1 Tax=Plodia interpunctella TaxID=58824 RepID=UPI00236838EA|nr:E3 ubiquitin-protein ligase RNF34 [Plodia interpunctella]